MMAAESAGSGAVAVAIAMSHDSSADATAASISRSAPSSSGPLTSSARASAGEIAGGTMRSMRERKLPERSKVTSSVVPVANNVDVANELLVVPQEKSASARVERGTALGGSALDHGGGRVREELPLTQPLRLERGGYDHETTADTAGVPEGVAGGNRLRRLAKTHVIGKEQVSPHEEPFNAVTLVGI